MAANPPRRSSRSHRSTLSLQKTEIVINVYDLLPPGKLSAALWFCGASLLHSGVVIKDREYAYGGHDRRGLTGVYWTKPRTQPPGGTFKCEILHGFTLASHAEIEATIREVSEEFLGPSYNLLEKNCNHFTAHLCQRLTGRAGPSWLNRAASIGLTLPCLVPRSWVEPPDFETADGELVDEDDTWDEQSRMLRSSSEGPQLLGQPRQAANPPPRELLDWDSEEDQGPEGGSGMGNATVPLRDTSGRALPAAEYAPPARGS